MGCARWMCGSAGRARDVSRRSARWQRPVSKSARSRTSRRFRTMDAVHRRGAAYRSFQFRVLSFGCAERLHDPGPLETRNPKLETVLPSGTKGEAKPVNRSSKGEETWHVIPMQYAVYAVVKASSCS